MAMKPVIETGWENETMDDGGNVSAFGIQNGFSCFPGGPLTNSCGGVPGTPPPGGGGGGAPPMQCLPMPFVDLQQGI